MHASIRLPLRVHVRYIVPAVAIAPLVKLNYLGSLILNLCSPSLAVHSHKHAQAVDMGQNGN